MKELFLKILKISLVVVAVILIVLLVFGLVLRLDWPWWVGIFLLLLLVGLGIGVVFIKKLLQARREQSFVQQVIEQDDAYLKTLAAKEKNELRELQDSWKEAVDSLRRSQLKKSGNPLYVLPWYLVIGESGSGKTTALNSAHLSSPFVEVKRTSGISGTRNCDWWFFEKAIIIDTAGRYAIPIDGGKDKEEWQKFLNLLVKYRKKEPIHGLIVTIAANKLCEASPEILEENGKTIRRRIDELMRVLGIKFPIYVLITKCDLVQGMSQFSEHLPDASLDQPMGVINQSLSADWSAFLDMTMNTIGERLRNLRILLLHQPHSKGVDPGLLLFPEEVENIRRGLTPFMQGAFQVNPYQETPILRGLFFSSGRQEGSPYSHFLNALGMIGEKDVLPGTNKGLFLHDFFAKVLISDRGLFAPTRRAIEWSTLTRNLGVTSWILLIIAVCGLLSFSFVKNLKAIRGVSHEFARPQVLTGQTIPDLITMDRFQKTILALEDQNRNWWIPRFSLNESIDVEMGLKDKYCKQFQSGFLVALDKNMENALPGVVTASSAYDEVIGHYIIHLVRRINLLKARLDGEQLPSLKQRPQPSYIVFQPVSDQSGGTEIRKKFGELYLYYLVWRSDSADINKEIAILQAWLKYLLASKMGTLQWLVLWVNQQGDIPSVTLGEFWSGSGSLENETSIMPAFTRKGKEMIDALLKEIAVAAPDATQFANQEAAFERWYHAVYCEAWQKFATFFPNGVQKLKGVQEWQQTAAIIATDRGPYFALLNKIALELEPLVASGNLPQWLQQTYQLQMIRAQGDLKDQTPIAKTAQRTKEFITDVEKKLGKKEGGESLDLQPGAGKTYQDYRSALNAVAPAAASSAQAYHLAFQVFNEDPVTSKSPFYIAQSDLQQLKTNLIQRASPDETFWRLVTGPLDYLWIYVRRETACYLTGQWEEKVLAEAQGETARQEIPILLAPEGPVRKFVMGPAAPFIGWSVKKGYYPKEALGGTIAFEPSFFDLLSKRSVIQTAAQAQRNYPVTIKGLPTDANTDAGVKPHRSQLELNCSSGPQTLVNLNYPVTKTFSWSPETCSDVIFQISVGDVILTKQYTGAQAFPQFLQEFPGGNRTFYPRDFPDQRESLEGMGIKYIKVNYHFTGDRAVIEQGRPFPVQIPRSIAKCWH
jgi:type VI secretion system protein ImpL